ETGSCSRCCASTCEPIISSCYQSCVITIVKLVVFVVLVFLAYKIVLYYLSPQEGAGKSMSGFIKYLLNEFNILQT
uniref:Uncharacterized protein n=1 Tax=Anopheles albimanus TaxID=7167 RepID=A0A182FZJ2_ANOAL